MATKSPCPLPWLNLRIERNGDVRTCCESGQIMGNIRRQPLEEIWNGEGYRSLRRQLADGEFDRSPCRTCWHVGVMGKYSDGDAERRLLPDDGPTAANAERVWEDFEAGRDVVRGRPLRAEYQFPFPCNLHCVMCRQRLEPKEGQNAFPREILGPVLDWLGPGLDHLRMAGGEVFVQWGPLALLDRLIGEKDFRVAPSIVTNATLLHEQWPRLDAFEQLHVDVSLDGCTKETFESIRLRAVWEEVYRNFQDLLRRRDERPGWRVRIIHVLQRRNLHELPEMIRFARDHRVPVYVAPIYGPGYDRENIFVYNDLLDLVPDWPDRFDRAIAEAGREPDFSPGTVGVLGKLKSILAHAPKVTAELIAEIDRVRDPKIPRTHVLHEIFLKKMESVCWPERGGGMELSSLKADLFELERASRGGSRTAAAS